MTTITTVNIEELRAQVATTVAANMKKVKAAAEVAGLKATLKLESSPELFDARVRLEANGQQTARLQSLVSECQGIIANVPISNPKTRTNREWASRRRFTYGSQIDLMYQLATGILYSCAEHKQLLLAHTGLDVELIEQIVNAFGAPTYYSRNYHTVVEQKPYDLELVKSTVQVMQSQLSVVVDTLALTKSNFDDEFLAGENLAKGNYNQAVEAIEGADLAV
jgi:hypothetical protein